MSDRQGLPKDRQNLPVDWPCATCARLHAPFNAITPTCDAFPDGLPDVMVMGLNDHKMPLPGDHGLRYLKLTPVK